MIRSEARMRYECDADGNWVLKTVENRDGTEEEFRLSGVERRRLTYFERGDPSEA